MYNTFTELEKGKVKKLLLHERLACEHAFRLLVSRQSPDSVSIRHFAGMIKFYKPNVSECLSITSVTPPPCLTVSVVCWFQQNFDYIFSGEPAAVTRDSTVATIYLNNG